MNSFKGVLKFRLKELRLKQTKKQTNRRQTDGRTDRQTNKQKHSYMLCLINQSYLNVKIFLFQFKYFSKPNPPKSDPSPADLTRPDGNLELNIGKINIVFLYRFITELLVSISFCVQYVSVSVPLYHPS